MKKLSVSAAVLAASALWGCGDSVGPDGTSVSLSFAATGGVPASPPAVGQPEVAAGYSMSDGQNTLLILSAEVVLREIDLKRQAGADCGTADCEKFDVGPIVMDVPLDGTTAQSISVSVPPDTYREVEFEIHKVATDPTDDAIRLSHPHLDQKSIQVTGTWNGTAFTYWTDLNVEQKLDLVPALVIDAATVETNVTVRLDLAQWFRDGSGVLVDPDTANKGGQNESLVNDNIKQSIEAFEDKDRDGDNLDEIGA